VRKKLIKAGHTPHPGYIRANIRRMEEQPFDGLVFPLRACGGRYFWHPAPVDERDFQEDFRDLEKIEWGKFTDNFILVWTAAGKILDWFDDGHWAAVEHNMRLVARSARLGRCGIALEQGDAAGLRTSHPLGSPEDCRGSAAGFRSQASSGGRTPPPSGSCSE